MMQGGMQAQQGETPELPTVDEMEEKPDTTLRTLLVTDKEAGKVKEGKPISIIVSGKVAKVNEDGSVVVDISKVTQKADTPKEGVLSGTLKKREGSKVADAFKRKLQG